MTEDRSTATGGTPGPDAPGGSGPGDLDPGSDLVEAMADVLAAAWKLADDGEPPASPAPDVLELRVHGISNTPPATMLAVTPEEVVRADGDELGSFWTLTPEALASYAETEAPAAGWVDPRHVPVGVRREAYSWGALARVSAVPGLRVASGIVNGVIRALWVLIIPFGMVNVAYWTRDLDEPRNGWRAPKSGALVRLFGLALTLLWVTTAVTVTLGVVAAQCYLPEATVPGHDDLTYVQACSALPDALDPWARWETGTRSAVLTLLAVGAVLVLALVGSTGTVKYDRIMSRRRARQERERLAELGGKPYREKERPAGWPWLAQPGFWSHVKSSSAMWRDHVAAGFALISLLLTWQLLTLANPGCATTTSWLRLDCLDPSGWEADQGKSWHVLVVLSLALLVAVAVRVAVLRVEPDPRSTDPRGWIDTVLLAAATGVLGWSVIELATRGDAPIRSGDPTAGPDVAAFVGVETVPALLIFVMVLLVIAAFGVRGRLPAFVWAVLVVGALVAALQIVVARDAGDRGLVTTWTWVLAALVAGLAAAAFGANRRHSERHREGWRGRGPSTFLALGAGFGMVLAGATVAGLLAWLEAPSAPENVATPEDVQTALGGLEAGDLLRDPVLTTVGDPQQVHLWTPPGYQEFAATSVLVLLAIAVASGVLTVRAVLQKRAVPVVPAVIPPGPAAPATSEEVDYPAVERGRVLAALAHRAERVVGWLASAFWVALVVTLLARPAGTAEKAGQTPSWFALDENLEQWSTRAILLLFGLIVASVVVAGSKQSLVRPWGLLWDLMCFLPRVAHPFAPPCYAERVVPELRSRVDDWLGVEPDAESRHDGVTADELARRRVVLSAHSLGAVVAVAAIIARWDVDDPERGHRSDRVALLTYGTQLRSHFGRFFPELFGPQVLGTRENTGPRVWAYDPWLGSATPPTLPPVVAPPGTPEIVPPPTLVGSLAGATRREVRWRGLWRRTDFIGFPVDGYHDGTIPTPGPEEEGLGPRDGWAIDHVEEEVDDTSYLFKVATHGGDQKSQQYRKQLDRLLQMLRT